MSAAPTPSRRVPAPDLAAWLGVAPFFVFAAMFLIAPTAWLLVGAFQDHEGAFTLGNIVRLGQPSIRLSYWLSLEVSVASATLGALIGLALALAALRGGLPSWLRPTLMTFSGVASNFAGVPLAFAFMATLGRLGLVTVLLRNIGVDLYAHGFNILTFWGLTITYLYFQIPLMVLVVTLTGLRAIDVRTLTEAAESQGAGAVTILFRIILPNMRAAILSGAFLTFAIVIGEFTFASLLDRPAFGPFLQLIGASRAYEPSALAVMAFALTWACLGLMQLVGGAPASGLRR